MTATEQMAVLIALQKAVKARLDEVRAEADAELLADYEDSGVTKRALKLGGIKVGDFIVALNQGVWTVTDEGAFLDFALSYGFASYATRIRPEWMYRAKEVLLEELPEAIEEYTELDRKWQDYIVNVAGEPQFMQSGMRVPGLAFTGQTVKGTQARGCRPEDVVPIIRRLGGVDALLLGEPAASDAPGQSDASGNSQA